MYFLGGSGRHIKFKQRHGFSGIRTDYKDHRCNGDIMASHDNGEPNRSRQPYSFTSVSGHYFWAISLLRGFAGACNAQYRLAYVMGRFSLHRIHIWEVLHRKASGSRHGEAKASDRPHAVRVRVCPYCRPDSSRSHAQTANVMALRHDLAMVPSGDGYGRYFKFKKVTDFHGFG